MSDGRVDEASDVKPMPPEIKALEKSALAAAAEKERTGKESKESRRTDQFVVPPEAASVLKDIDNACSSVLQQLGSLEADYQASKVRLLEELRGRRQQFKTLVDDSARKAGVDIDRQRWNLDFQTMTLVRAS